MQEPKGPRYSTLEELANKHPNLISPSAIDEVQKFMQTRFEQVIQGYESQFESKKSVPPRHMRIRKIADTLKDHQQDGIDGFTGLCLEGIRDMLEKEGLKCSLETLEQDCRAVGYDLGVIYRSGQSERGIGITYEFVSSNGDSEKKTKVYISYTIK